MTTLSTKPGTVSVMKGIISDSWSRLTGQPAVQLLLDVAETDAAEVMEAGLILPEPGQEMAWFEEHKDELSELAPEGVRGL
jgi:hypothetical protein